MMANDPRSFVRVGDKLRIAATQINALNALIRPNVGFQADGLVGYGPLNTIILARNTTEEDLPRWGVMEINGIEINPSDNDISRRSFEEMPCVRGETPDIEAKTPIVAVEPIRQGEIGRVAAAGVVQIKADDVAKVVGATVLWKNDDWALIRFGDNKHIRLGLFSGAWPKAESKSVTRLNGDGSVASPASTFIGTNHFSDIAADCGDRKAAFALVDDTWVLIAAEC